LELKKEIENRWMPPSPHKEEVLRFLERGRAHIEERGHNVPPLLVFEDGGVMELPLARYKDGNFSPAEGETASRQTKYYDVCGSLDELKKLLEEKPELAKSDPAQLVDLIDDACYMLSRMQGRREKYKAFAEAVARVSERLNKIGGPEVEDAYQKAEELRNFLKNSPEKVTEKLQELYEMAEGMRKVANPMESQVLYVYRDLAIELSELYAQIKGSRKWEKKG
jgi:gas vesicle protein